MRIAQITLLYEAVPPKFYGGTERVVSYLTDPLIDLGHDVTLFASGDSQTKATLQAAWPRALRLDPTIRDALATCCCSNSSAAARTSSTCSTSTSTTCRSRCSRRWIRRS